MSACRDPKATSPLERRGAISRQDSVQRGYFLPQVPTSLTATTCGENECPQFIGAEPGFFQGAGQPSPITLTFSGPVGFLRVSGRGAIKCTGGQYGTLVGYDSAGAELGRVDLHLIEPSDCSPPDAPDDVTYGAEADLITRRPIARAEILPMSPLEFMVYDQQGYASATYGVIVGKGNLGAINLTCTDSVVRGEVTSCTAAAADPMLPLAVTGWMYSSVDGDSVSRNVNPSSPTWQGRLVVDGYVVVTGKVGGVAGQSTPQPVAVIPRNWQGKVARKDHQVVSPSTMEARPTGFDGQLGKTTLMLPLDAVAMTDSTVIINDEGPNEGFFYLTALPVLTHTRPQVNTNALNSTSDFYKIQESRQKTIGGVTYCAQSFVLGIIPLIQAHEGYTPDVQPNSHSGIFRRHVDTLGAVVFERAAGRSDGPAVSLRRDSVFNSAVLDSDAMDRDTTRNNIKMSCQFRYDYSRLK